MRARHYPPAVLLILASGLAAGCISTAAAPRTTPRPPATAYPPTPPAPPPSAPPATVYYPPAPVYPSAPPPSSPVSRPSPPTPRPASPPPRSAAAGRVTFFTEPNFRGDSFTVGVGEELPDLGGWNDDISSWRVEGAARVTVFSDAGFRGIDASTVQTTANLGTIGGIWDNRISSLRVEGDRGVAIDPFESPPPTIVYVAPPAPPPPPEPRYSPRAAEEVVRRAYRDTFAREVDAAGLRTYRERLLSDDWTEDQLRAHLRSSEEFLRMDHRELIRQAYRDILKREADDGGLDHYRRLMINDGWTLAQVRSELLRSNERVTAIAYAAVNKAYRELLGREPDTAGFQWYTGRMISDGWSEEQVRLRLRESEEYRNRQK